MKRTAIHACIVIWAASSGGVVWAQADATPAVVDARQVAKAALRKDPDLRYSPNTILVRFDDRFPAAYRDAARSLVGGRSLHEFSVSGLEHLEVTLPVDQAVGALEALPFVVYAEPDYVVTAMTTPNDPHFGLLWGMHSIRAPEAWSVATGDNDFLIAVIDSGVQYTHVDLAANWSGLGWDFYDNDSDPWDEYGHGTHVAGTLGAVGNNGIGVVGVNWNIRIMALRFLGPDGRGFTSDAVLALEYAVNAGARISNNSWGGGGFSQAMYDKIIWAGNQGHLFVCAAGNSSSNIDRTHPVLSYAQYPPSYNLPNMISVAAIDSNDNLASFSNYGAISIHMGAPGVNIASTYLNNSYAYADGTSMAAPHVAGAAALYWGAHPQTTMNQVRQQILTTVRPIASLDGRTTTGGTLDLAAVMDLGGSGGGGGGGGGGGATEPPESPTDLAAQALPGRQVRIEWSHDAQTTEYLEIERSRLQGNSWRGQTLLGPIDGSASSHIDSPGNGTYRYRIRGVNQAGPSDWSGFVQVTTFN